MFKYLRKAAAWLITIVILPGGAGCTFSSRTQHSLFKKIEHRRFDAIIVPGLPFENNRWNRTMMGRIYWAKYLYDRGITKNIIFSGSAVYSPYYEAKIMALYAAALGIPAEHIYTENRAEHSTENVYYSYKLAKKLGFREIAVASDPFQAKLMRRFIRKKIDPAVAIIPFVTDTLRVLEPGFITPEIDYAQAFKKDFIPITKRENSWKRWRGTRGRNIDSSLYR